MTELASLRQMAERHAGRHNPLLPRLVTATFEQTTDIEPLIYDPVVTLVLQGKKRVIVGDQTFEYGAGECMVVAAEIAAMGQISEASEDRPFVAVGLVLDPIILSDLMVDLAGMSDAPTEPGFGVSTASPPLLDAWRRILELLDRPEEIAVMARHLEHEVTFRLLMGPHGRLLRQLAGSNSRLARIRHALAWMRERYAERLSVEDVASEVGMSASVFHRHFKAVIGLSPLQYQRQIRLHEARKRMIADVSDAAAVGFAVGYKSRSQFSREYSRLFGDPPVRDANRVKSSQPHDLL